MGSGVLSDGPAMLALMPEQLERDLEWDDDSERCFTILQGLTPVQALQVLLPDAVTDIAPALEVERWVDVSWGPDEEGEYRQIAFAGTHEGWTWVFEPNGFAGSNLEPSTLTPVPSRYVSVYWNVNAVMRFRYLVDGELGRDFDPLSRADESADDEPDSVDIDMNLLGAELVPEGDPLPQEDDIDWTEPRQASVSLLVSLSGVSWPPTNDLVRSATAAVGYTL